MDQQAHISIIPPDVAINFAAIPVESTILAAVLLNSSLYAVVSDRLSPEMFLHPSNKNVYMAMQSVFNRNNNFDSIDHISVTHHLQKHHQLESLSNGKQGDQHRTGNAYIQEMLSQVPTTAMNNLDPHLKDVELQFTRASLQVLGMNVTRLAKQGKVSEDSLRKQFNGLFSQFTSVTERNELITATQSAQAELARYEEAERMRAEGLDQFVGGAPLLHMSDLERLKIAFLTPYYVTVGARQHMGKTAFVHALIDVALQHDVPVLCVTPESEFRETSRRIATMRANVSLSGVMDAELDKNDAAKYKAELTRIESQPLYHDDSFETTPEQIRTRVLQVKAENPNIPNGLSMMVIVDYIQLVKSAEKSGRLSERERIATVSRKMKALSKDGAYVVCTAQIRRAVSERQNARPEIDDLGGSSQLESDADLMLFLYREDRAKEGNETDPIANQNTLEVISRKNKRYGNLGTSKLFISPISLRHSNLARKGDIEKAYIK